MTEFELIQVEYMQKEYATNLMDNFYGSVAAMGDQATVIFTLIFGYLLVAHFVGQKLSRPQTVLLTICYLAMTIKLSVHTIIQGFLAEQFMNEYLLVIGREQGPPPALQAWLTIDTPVWYFVYIIASLYYMWSVRHPKTE
jgi:hypothetical protein